MKQPIFGMDLTHPKISPQVLERWNDSAVVELRDTRCSEAAECFIY